MKRQHTYERMMAQKLNGINPPAVAGLWSNMESILDREMPQQERKRRVGAWWFSTNVLVAACVLTAVGCAYTLKQLGANETTANAEMVTTKFAAEMPANNTAANVESSATTAEAKPQTNIDGIATVAETPVATAPYQPKKQPVALQTNASLVNEAMAQENVSLETPVQNSTEAIGHTVAQVKKNETVIDAQQTEGENNNMSDAASIRIDEAPAVEVESVKPSTPAVFSYQDVKTMTAEEMRKKVGLKKRSAIYFDKGVSVGVSLNAPVAIGRQMRNELDMNGKNNKWQDYLPSVYAQVHLSKFFSVKAEWMPVSAQYTPNFTLYHNIDEPNPDEKEEKVVKLNKLFYTSIPVSVQYNTPLKNVSVSLGVQYSLLKKVILQDQEYYHVIGVGGWNVMERKNEVAARDPNAVRNHNSGDVADDVARSIRREDWRLLSEVSYNFKGINAGVRYTRGLNNYINSNFTNLQVKDRNNSLQVYLRYNIFDSRKK